MVAPPFSHRSRSTPSGSGPGCSPCAASRWRRKAISGDPSRPWSVKELWHDLLEQGLRITVWEAPPESRWDDLGTADDLGRAVREEMGRRNLSRWIDPQADVAATAQIGPGCSVEFGARIASDARLEDAVVFPGGEVQEGQILTKALRNPAGDLPWDPR